ncbi:hypothetical protein C8T65DRAFT_741511 [Cerioporus squamosus]|nr:hypothetical protein C8T65DRAFT_741511 [Cerioporus squamosus]
MLVFTPFTSQAYISYQDAFSQADYFESMTRQAAQEYAMAHARVQAIQRQRERESYHRHQSQATCLNYVSGVHSHSWAASYPQRAPVRPAAYYSFEELALGVRRDQELRRDLLREREAQRQRALADAERRARALAAQRKQEQERRQAQRMQGQEAFLAFLGMMAQVATQVDTPQPGSSARRQSTPVSAPDTAAKPVDRKGKGKAVEVPVASTAASGPAPSQPSQEVPSLKEELEARIRNETDPDVQESLLLLYSDLFDSRRPAESQPVAGPSKPKQARFRVPVEESAASPSSHSQETTPAPEPQPTTDGAPLHRTHALPPAVASKLLKFYRARRARKLSLGEIKEVEDALRKLQETFEFPEHLDFVNPVPSDATAESDSDEPGRLAYTSNNTPLHAYEHALNTLLTRLDAVESNGDLEVRGRRKEVVREVERALEVVERRVEESRERERRASSALSVEAETAPAVAAGEEVKADKAPAVEPTPVSEAAPVVDNAFVVAIATGEVSQDVSSHAADSHSHESSAVQVEATLAHGASVEPSAPRSAAEADDTPASVNEVSSVLNTDDNSTLEEAQGAPVVPSTTPSPAELTEDAPVAAAEDDTPDVVTEVPSTPSSSEYILPSVSLSSPTPGTQAPEAISRIASSATDTTNATFATADTELLPTSDKASAPDTQAPEAISRIASSATDTTDATFLTADAELPPASASDDASSPVPSSNPEPMTRTESSASSSAGEGAFLLSSTPLADEPKRRASDASAEDELEIISKEELEAAKNDSDWSDLDSDA